MSLISYVFFVFIFVSALIYFIVPKRYQWIVLLLGSYVFYLTSGFKIVLFLLFTTVTTFYLSKAIRAVSDRQFSIISAEKNIATKEEINKIKFKYIRKKRIIISVLLITNFGILVYLKLFNDISESINSIIALAGSELLIPKFNLFLPLGISFYTFQSTGYAIDVYRGKIQPESNIARYALFVSFFPQLIQGPISRFSELANQLYESHAFDYTRAKHGIQLMLWGYFKKLVIADRVSILVAELFGNYENYSGFYIPIAFLAFSIQIYADFSGGVDIARGIAQIFGIILPQNFRQPYFAESLPEHWRRWHITLNEWWRDYLFYPITLSKRLVSLGKKCRKVFGPNIGKYIPIYLGINIVRVINALWHGASWKYIVSGFYYGILIILGMILKPLFDKIINKFKIRTDCFSWRLFKILRTFALVNIGKALVCASSVSVAWQMMVSTFEEFNPWIFTTNEIFSLGLNARVIAVLFISLSALFIVDLMHEKGIKIRETLEKQNYAFQWIIMLIALFAILIFGVYGSGYDPTDFIYQQF